MKKTLKAVLPRSAINMAVDIKDRLGLAHEGRLAFNPANLRLSSAIALPRIFNHPEIAAAWAEDSKVISTLYGDEDNYGGVNPGDRRALYYLIMALTPRNVLEVGTHIGASTLHIAMALKRLGQNAKVVSADILDVNDPNGPWKQVGLSFSPAGYAKSLECLEYIEFKVGRCLDFMGTTKERFDFIFLDGDHRARAVYQEVGAALKILNPGGVILLHDFYPGAKALYPDKNTITGPFHALGRIHKENPQITTLPLGALPWPTKQGVNLTSLALVCKTA
jgi:predicted O-methyltransferase YrrM